MICVLDWMEFQVLAAARGMEMYYGFPMGIPIDADGQEQAARYAVYQMTRDGILAKEEDGLKIQLPYSDYMDIICASRGLVVIDRGGDGLPRQCVYHRAGIYVCLEESQVEDGKVCLSGMDWDGLCRQMEDLGQLPTPRLKDGIGAYDYGAYWRGHMPGELWELLGAGCEVETDVLLEDPLVYSVFSLRDGHTGELRERMLLLDSPLEYCLLHQSPDGAASPVPYSREAAFAILRTWWRDGT